MAVSRKSPSTDTAANAIADCLARHVDPGQRLLVGLSGGIDSVVLLHATAGLGYAVSATHVHHGLSPNADQWADFCRNTCRQWGVDLRIERVEVDRTSADGLEAAARRVRHARLAASGADWLLLGHHRQDRAETVLFNLLRGAGVRGAGAVRQRNGTILRPLLAVGRADIRAYASAMGLHWVEDESNRDERHSRNYLRRRIFPALEARFPAASARLAAAAERFSEAGDLLDELAMIDLAMAPAEFPVEVELLRRLSEPRARNVLRLLLHRAGTGIPSDDRLAEALRQLLRAAPDRHPMIRFGERCLRRRKHLIELD